MKLFKRIASALLVIAFATCVYADSIVTGSKPFTFIPGTTISSSQVNADFDYIINQVNTNAAKNGANSSITSLLGLTTPISPNVGGSNVYVSTSTGGTADAMTISATTPAISSFSLVTGNTIVFKAIGINTVTSPTVNVNGTGAVGLSKPGNLGTLGLRPGETSTNQLIWATYDGTVWVVANMPRLFGGSISLTSVATTSLLSAGGHFAKITGSGTITSFGTTANLAEPIWFVRFENGPHTITCSASLLCPGVLTSMVFQDGDTAIVEAVAPGWRITSTTNNRNLPPTIQSFTTGTALTYTSPVNVLYINVLMCGGGGGGAAQTTNNGTIGGTTSFGSWTAIGGGPGLTTNAGGTGGTGGANGTGTQIVRLPGADGPNGTTTSSSSSAGNPGAVAIWGGGARTLNNTTSGSAKTNSAGGGAGAFPNNGTGGGAGAAGECVEFQQNAGAGLSITYTVGAGGNGGAAGTLAGGNGAAGRIIVKEYYQ